MAGPVDAATAGGKGAFVRLSTSVGEVHWLHHGEFAALLVLLVLMLYWPPRAMQKLSGARMFLEAHFGDSIGLYILHLGIVLVVIAGIWPDMQRVGELGYALVTAAMGVLKLSKTPPSNGGTVVDTHTVAPLDPAPAPPLPTSAMLIPPAPLAGDTGGPGMPPAPPAGWPGPKAGA